MTHWQASKPAGSPRPLPHLRRARLVQRTLTMASHTPRLGTNLDLREPKRRSFFFRSNTAEPSHHHSKKMAGHLDGGQGWRDTTFNDIPFARRMYKKTACNLTVCVTGRWAGVDKAWEQDKLEARKILKNTAESHLSSARFVRRDEHSHTTIFC